MNCMTPELVVDSFAGGGGASLGIELALGRSPDIAINHDAEALAMHAAESRDKRRACTDAARSATHGYGAGTTKGRHDGQCS